MTTQHTPTPWMLDGRPVYLVKQDDTTKKWSVAAHGKTICRLGTTDEDRANAAFIVRACNAHEELVVALKAALPRLEQLDENLTEAAEDMDCGYLGVPELSLVRAAIAKAEGK